MWTRELLKNNAKEIFRRNYWTCVGVSLVLTVLIGGGGSVVGRIGENNINISYHNYGSNYYYGDSARGFMVSMFAVAAALIIALATIAFTVFAGNVFKVGGCSFFIKNRNMTGTFGNILDGFKSGHYGNVVKTMFFYDLYIALWSLLLVIPGIVKSYEYRMVPYILAENPGMDYKQVLEISKRMMNGQKMETFILDLSFIGWQLLAGITCGIAGIFYVNPYINATNTELYAFNKVQAYNEGYIR